MGQNEYYLLKCEIEKQTKQLQFSSSQCGITFQNVSIAKQTKEALTYRKQQLCMANHSQTHPSCTNPCADK